MKISAHHFNFALRFWKKLAKGFARNLTAFFCQSLFGRKQSLFCDFQIVVAVAKFDEQFGQGNHVFNLETQRASAPTAHFFKFRPLFFRHTDIELKCFFRHACSVPDRIFELMAKCD